MKQNFIKELKTQYKTQWIRGPPSQGNKMDPRMPDIEDNDTVMNSK